MNTSANVSNSTVIDLTPVATCYIMLGILGTLGNVAIVCIIFKQKSLHSQCYYLMQELAISDAISCLSFFELGVLMIFGPVSNNLCAKACFPMTFSLAAGNILMLAIGIDRFCALYLQNLYDNIANTLAVTFTVVAWLSGFGFSTTAIVESTDDLLPICVPPTAMQLVTMGSWNNCGLGLNVLIISVYLSVIVRAKFVLGANGQDSNASLTARKNARKMKVIKTLLIVVFVFIFSWMGTMVCIKILSVLDVSEEQFVQGIGYIGLTCLANIVPNFIIYACRMSEFRDAVKSCLRVQHNTVARTSVAPTGILVTHA